MKAIVFEVPAMGNESVVVQEDRLSYFYNHYHKHEQIQITAILSGGGKLTTKMGLVDFTSGEVYIIGQNQAHLFKSDDLYFDESSSKYSHAIHIYFKKESILDNFKLQEFEEARKFINIIGEGLKLEKAYSDTFIRQILNICNSAGLQRLYYFFEFLKYSYIKIDKYSYLNGSVHTARQMPYNLKTRINDIYNYTLAHFSEDISLDDIAKVANMTNEAMCKYFKKSTRKTYMDFLREVRIDFACRKIVGGEFGSISEVAYSSGFKNPITFNRIFKVKTGLTPTEYMQVHKKNVSEPKIIR